MLRLQVLIAPCPQGSIEKDENARTEALTVSIAQRFFKLCRLMPTDFKIDSIQCDSHVPRFLRYHTGHEPLKSNGSSRAPGLSQFKST